MLSRIITKINPGTLLDVSEDVALSKHREIAE
jgi:hypothetical protein